MRRRRSLLTLLLLQVIVTTAKQKLYDLLAASSFMRICVPFCNVALALSCRPGPVAEHCSGVGDGRGSDDDGAPGAAWH